MILPRFVRGEVPPATFSSRARFAHYNRQQQTPVVSDLVIFIIFYIADACELLVQILQGGILATSIFRWLCSCTRITVLNFWPFAFASRSEAWTQHVSLLSVRWLTWSMIAGEWIWSKPIQYYLILPDSEIMSNGSAPWQRPAATSHVTRRGGQAKLWRWGWAQLEQARQCIAGDSKSPPAAHAFRSGHKQSINCSL